MPTTDDLSNSNYVRKGDIGKGKLWTIKSWEKLNVAKQGEKPDMRYCIWFEEFDKPMTLNKTNGNLIAKVCGSADFDNWIGHQVVLYVDEMVEFGGNIVGGIRIRAPKSQNPPPEEDCPF